MSREPDEPIPFRDLPAGDREEAFSVLFRKVRDPDALRPSELANVRFRLLRRRARGSGRRGREAILVLAALLSGVGVAFGGWGVIEWSRGSAREGLAAPSSAPRAPGPARAASGGRGATRPSASAPSEPPAPSATPSDTPVPAAPRASEPAPTPNDDAPPPPSSLARESEALTRALVALRRERDARTALALLDAYEAEFPSGALSLEARVARVDALIALGNRAAALRVLAGLPLERVGRAWELRLLRAELYAESDCAPALPDLDRLIEAGPAAQRERALHARAVCRLRLGDHAGARRDLRAYLDAYPQGRFASPVRHQLERLGAE